MKNLFLLLISLSLASMMLFSKPNNPGKTDNSYFIENKGQWPSDVRYLAKINGMNAWITNNGVVYDFYKIEKDNKSKPQNNRMMKLSGPRNFKDGFNKVSGHVVRMTFEKGKSDNSIQSVKSYGKELQNTYHNYFIGKDKLRWVSHVPLYKEAITENVYNGIDARFYFDNGNVRYDYIIKPGADISEIKMKIDMGKDSKYSTSINNNGELVIKTSIGEIVHNKLFAYQTNERNNKNEVKCRFIKNIDGTIGFKADNYDKSKALIIDPLIYSTFIGSIDSDWWCEHQWDNDGNLVMTGYALSNYYPTTTGAYDETYNGGDFDIYVTKMNSSLSEMIFSTFIGGNGWEAGWGITVDASNDIFISCASSSSNFPTTPGAYDEYHNGSWDNAIVKLNSPGTELIYSTYIGGSNEDAPINRIVLDNDNNLYIIGYTYSNDFPVTPGCYNPTFGGEFDGYVAKLNSDGSGLIFSTYLSGSDYDNPYGIIRDNYNQLIICGVTNSNDFYFTNNLNPELTPIDPNSEIFILKLNYDATDVIYSTRLGGSDLEIVWDMAQDSEDNILVGGFTYSTDYPTTVGAYSNTYSGSDGSLGFGDAILFKLNPDGNELLFSTYYGSTGDDAVYSLLTDDDNRILVNISTSSPDLPTTTGTFDDSYDGASDINLICFSADGSQVLYSSYLGGDNYDVATRMSLDFNKNLTITGSTYSSGYPVTDDAFCNIFMGGFDPMISDNFITILDILSVKTIVPYDIGDISAKSGGEIPSGYNVIAKGVCWSTNPNPTLSDSYSDEGGGEESFESQMINLIPETQYYVRAYATNQNGTVNGEELEFTTLADNTPPVALCQNFTLNLPITGTGTINASDIDNGSYDESGEITMSVAPGSFTCNDIGEKQVTLTVTDNYSNSSTCEAIVTVVGPALNITISVSPSPTVTPGGQENTIYLGYGEQSVTLTATSGFTYVWSDGTTEISTNQSVIVTPKVTTTYTVTASNSYGCYETASVTITVIDVVAGNNKNQIYICHKGTTTKVSKSAVESHLKHGDYLGECTTKKKEVETELLITDYCLSQNYPNPFSSTSNIEYSMPEAGFVSLKIYDIYSREVAVLVNHTQSAGTYDIEFDSSKLPSGIYIYRLDVNGISLSKQMIILK